MSKSRRASIVGAVKKVVDVGFMARDALRLLIGRDYFRYPDVPGRFPSDPRFYHIDLRAKADWTGDYQDGVPVLYVPSLSRNIMLPAMILQYGLGCLERYFESSDESYVPRVDAVLAWLTSAVASDGSLDNHSAELHPDRSFHSNNSAMTLGLAISLLVRIADTDLPGLRSADQLGLATRLVTSMLRPLDEGGTASYAGLDLVLHEYARVDDYVVLNGWVFGILGLHDYWRVTQSASTKDALQATVDTLARWLERFMVPARGWSYYDNRGRLASPTYQVTHITQMQVLFGLTGRECFAELHRRLRTGYSMSNRIRYTARKIAEKLCDSHRYSTQR